VRTAVVDDGVEEERALGLLCQRAARRELVMSPVFSMTEELKCDSTDQFPSRMK
jgi:hypothetical protein